ncbi:MAG: hypothetical protein PUD81_02355 [Eggerthellales bacterium]|nr:hypothetical protein [Eggerthellales bacterium]
MNEKLEARFAAVKKIIDELDYAGLLEKDATADEYDGESVLVSLCANPALGKDANATLFGFVFSYLFNDPKPSKAWCYLAAERLCAEVPAFPDDPADPVKAVQAMLGQMGIERVMQEMEASLAASDIPEGVIPHVVLRMAVMSAGLNL